MTNTEQILLKRKHMLLIKEGKESATKEKEAMIGSFLSNIQNLGFTFAQKTMTYLMSGTEDAIVGLYGEIVPVLKEMVGADKEYNPMYPNFPEQVMEADKAELFWNAFIHYASFGTLLPEYEEKERFPLIGEYKLTELNVGTEEDMMSIFTNLVASKTSLSNQDKEDMAVFVKETDFAGYLPDEVPLKENCAFLGKLIMENCKDFDPERLNRLFGTPTDVLRLLAALSDGDISLSSAKNIRFRKLKRPERRFVMDLLCGCKKPEEDMFRYRALWVTAGEILHPGEFAKNKKYGNIVNAFRLLRENKKPLFWSGKVEEAIKKGHAKEAIELLKQRPGEFARRLNKLFSIGDSMEVMQNFADVADAVATPVLWQVKEYFAEREESKNGVRVFFPKGNTAKVFTKEEPLPPIHEEECRTMEEICDFALRKQYKERPEMGKVYIDKDLKHYAIPFSQRSAGSAFKMITRGSRIPIEKDKKILRSFIWWTNTERDDRVDVDLSVAVYDDNWKIVRHVSYTNLRDNDFRIVHSGDITNGGKFGGKGVAEFIDMDIDNIAEHGGRYAVVEVYCYNCIPFCKLPCSFGWMERTKLGTGKKFEAKSVQQNMALTADSYIAIPVIIDCKTREVVWADLNCTARSATWGNNLESNLKGATASAYAVVNMKKPSLYDLVFNNAVARGSVTMDRNAADIIFSNDTTKPVVLETTVVDGKEEVKAVEKDVPIITAYDLDYYMGQLL